MEVTWYNENDSFAADWLEELIGGGSITAGEVDRRNIQEVRPDEVRHHARAHFFAGIGGWDLALQLAGWPAGEPVWTGSCPCQPFSVAGKGLGERDERHLWPVWRELIAQCRPTALFGEQTASSAGRRWLATVRADLEELGYAVGAADLCAAGIGAPHLRQRLYFGAVRVGDAEDRERGLPAPTVDWQGVTVGGPSSSGGLGDATGPRQQGWAGEARVPKQRRRQQQPERSGSADRVVLPDRDGRQSRGKASETVGHRGPADAASGNGGLGDAGGEGGRRHSRAVPGTKAPGDCGRQAVGGEPDVAVVTGTDGRLGDANDGREGEERGFQGGPGAERERGENPWNDAEWLPCVEPKGVKWRPAQPGIFPMASRLPAGVVYCGPQSLVAAVNTRCASTGRIRGYGNSVVPQLAAQFVMALVEAANPTTTTRHQERTSE